MRNTLNMLKRYSQMENQNNEYDNEDYVEDQPMGGTMSAAPKGGYRQTDTFDKLTDYDVVPVAKATLQGFIDKGAKTDADLIKALQDEYGHKYMTRDNLKQLNYKDKRINLDDNYIYQLRKKSGTEEGMGTSKVEEPPSLERLDNEPKFLEFLKGLFRGKNTPEFEY